MDLQLKTSAAPIYDDCFADRRLASNDTEDAVRVGGSVVDANDPQPSDFRDDIFAALCLARYL